jgi:hypothetical protein
MLQHFPQHLCCRNTPVRRNGGSLGNNFKHFQRLAVLTLTQARFPNAAALLQQTAA